MAHVKDSSYFSHDSNARRDPKILALRSAYGMEGYGWYWTIIEMFREQPGFRLQLNSKYAFKAIAMELECDEERAKDFIKDCIEEFHLFETDGHSFWSNSLLRRMEMKEERSNRARRAAQARWDKEEECDGNANAMQTQSENSPGNASKVKESKVNIKESKKDIYTPILQHWNTQEIIQHRKLTEKTRRSIRATLKSYSVEEVNKAISNYAQILRDPVYYWTHKWTLQEFLQRGIDKFLDWEIASSNFRDNPKKPPQELPRGDPKEYAHEHKKADLRKAIERKTVQLE